jgi:hypothetical protein
MTAQDAVDEVRIRIGNPTTSEISDALLLRKVNQAGVDVVMVNPRKHPTLLTVDTLTTVADQDYNELANANVIHVAKVVDVTNNYELQFESVEEYVEGRIYLTTSSQPLWCVLYGEGSNGRPQIRWTPPPDDAYSVEAHCYVWTEQVLSPNVSTFDTEWRWDGAILERATELSFPLVQRLRDVKSQRSVSRAAEGRARASGPQASETLTTIQSPVGRELEDMDDG